MTSDSDLHDRSFNPLLVAVVVLLFGIVSVFHVSVFSGFRLAQDGPFDPRLINFILERNHQWLTGNLGDQGFWDPTFFYPYHGVGAFTDSLISTQPLYSSMRLAGMPTGIAYQISAIGLLAACFFSMWWLLRRGFGLTAFPAAAGAFLFAFGGPRAIQIGHVQLFAHFAMPLAMLGLVVEFREARRDRARWQWVALFAAAMVVEFYGSVYFAWCSCFLLLIAAVIALLWPRARTVVLESLRCKPMTWTVAAIVAMLAMLPILLPYLRAARTAAERPPHDVLMLLPPPSALLYPGPSNWIGAMTGMNQWPLFSRITAPLSHAMSLGVVTTLLVLFGFWLKRRDGVARLLGLVGLISLLIVIRWPGDVSAWMWVSESLPGGTALRAMGRIILPLLAFAGIALAASMEWIGSRWGKAAWIAVFLIVVLDQGHTRASFDWRAFEARSRAIAEVVPSHCDAFLFSPADEWTRRVSSPHYDAMWASLFTGIPTVNGHSGTTPADWYPMVKRAMAVNPDPRASRRLERGLVDAGMTGETVCWIRLEIAGHEVTRSEVIEIQIGGRSDR